MSLKSTLRLDSASSGELVIFDRARDLMSAIRAFATALREHPDAGARLPKTIEAVRSTWGELDAAREALRDQSAA